MEFSEKFQKSKWVSFEIFFFSIKLRKNFGGKNQIICYSKENFFLRMSNMFSRQNGDMDRNDCYRKNRREKLQNKNGDLFKKNIQEIWFVLIVMLKVIF